MPHLRRRSLFVGAAALPVLAVPRPLAAGGAISSMPIIWPSARVVARKSAWTIAYRGIGESGPEFVLPLKRGANGRLRVGKAVTAPAADEIDDRAFGWEG